MKKISQLSVVLAVAWACGAVSSRAQAPLRQDESVANIGVFRTFGVSTGAVPTSDNTPLFTRGAACPPPNGSERIRGAEADTELGRLAGVLNSAFARLEAAFAQQRQFTADASHELRTPLAVIISEAQTALARQRSADEYRETVALSRDGSTNETPHGVPAGPGPPRGRPGTKEARTPRFGRSHARHRRTTSSHRRAIHD